MLLTGVASFAQTAQVDPGVKPYKRVAGISGNLNSIGSDTLNNLMTLWAEAFRAQYPNVNIQIEGKGSSTAPPALISATSQLGPMSREMKSKEIDDFEKKFGYKPTAIKVAIDALAVFVHKDNPVEGLSLQQIDAIFSKNRKRGAENDITRWGDVLEPTTLEQSFANRPISLYGRNSASGTYGLFKKKVLQGGDYKDSVKEQPGSSAVIQGVGSDKYGIGYSGIGYKTAGVKALKIKNDGDGKLYEPNVTNSLTKKYPLARFLYVYVNKKPNQTLDPLTAEFLKFVLSKEGQRVVVKDGYYPLPAELTYGGSRGYLLGL